MSATMPPTLVTLEILSPRFGKLRRSLQVENANADIERVFLERAVDALRMDAAAWYAPPRADAAEETIAQISAAMSAQKKHPK